jgi:hypothetical protein
MPFLLDTFGRFRTPFEHYWCIRALMAHSSFLTSDQASEVVASYAKNQRAIESDSGRAGVVKLSCDGVIKHRRIDGATITPFPSGPTWFSALGSAEDRAPDGSSAARRERPSDSGVGYGWRVQQSHRPSEKSPMCNIIGDPFEGRVAHRSAPCSANRTLLIRRELPAGNVRRASSQPVHRRSSPALWNFGSFAPNR